MALSPVQWLEIAAVVFGAVVVYGALRLGGIDLVDVIWKRKKLVKTEGNVILVQADPIAPKLFNYENAKLIFSHAEISIPTGPDRNAKVFCYTPQGIPKTFTYRGGDGLAYDKDLIRFFALAGAEYNVSAGGSEGAMQKERERLEKDLENENIDNANLEDELELMHAGEQTKQKTWRRQRGVYKRSETPKGGYPKVLPTEKEKKEEEENEEYTEG